MPWRQKAEPGASSKLSGLKLGTLIEFLQHQRHQARRRARSGPDGERRTQGTGDALEFDRLVAFQPGDDVRRIDWRVSTITGRLQRRLHEAQVRMPTTIVLDRSASMASPVPQASTGRPMSYFIGCQVVLSVAWLAMRRHDPVTVVLPPTDRAEEVVIGPLRREAELSALHARLGAISPSGKNLPEAYAKLLESLRPRRRTVVFIGDFLDFAAEEQGETLRRFAASCGVTLAVVLDGHRCELSDLRQRAESALLFDSESPGQRLAFDLDEDTGKELKQATEDLRARLQRLVRGPQNRIFWLDQFDLVTQKDLLRWLGRTLSDAELF